jgi:four helix bundle protein
VSISANIAEGQGRASRKEFRHHLSIAYGSLCELETLVHLARRREYCNSDAELSILSKSDETARVLRGLLRSLESD